MKITKYGHSCLLIEVGEARILIDPGGLSKGFELLEGLTAVLLTHQHYDHLDVANLKTLLAKSPAMKIHADEGTVEALAAEPELPVVPAHAGEEFDLAGVSVKVVGTAHAQIHPTIPGIPNVGYLIAKRFFYPGDNFNLPSEPVDVLAVPTCGPWMKIAEAIDYMLAVAPEVAIPVHDGLLAPPDSFHAHLRHFAEPAGMDFRVIGPAETIEV
jgi:L-ascorbate metabolism protein UlaG (beta-lactamase superfamily)